MTSNLLAVARSNFSLGIFFAGFFITMCTGCLTTAALEDPTEHYIKTQVEQHDSGQQSTVRIFPLINLTATNCSTELQLTGYKYDGSKNIVICVRPFHMGGKTGATKVYDSLTFVELNVEEVRAIVTNYQTLEQKILAEKPVPGEYVYHDYTVNDRVFISYRGTLNPVLKQVIQSLTIDMWVNSVKYSLPARDLMDKLQVFLSY